MNQKETRLARVAYFALQSYVLALTVAWYCVDSFYHGPFKVYQETYKVIVGEGGGTLPLVLLFIASFFFWRIRRWAAVAGFVICFLWTAYAALPRL
jgi:hypothetical protein